METLFLLMKENKSKEIQGKNVLSFTKFVPGGFCPGGVLSCHHHAGSRIHKISSALSKIIGDGGGGGGGALRLRLIFCKNCVS